jgi:catechol 2,3-dioxygenase-like lactoylglutathione lyase family enzyme
MEHLQMIDHLSTYATDYPATARWYDAALKTLGCGRVMELVADWDPKFPTRHMAAYGPPGARPDYHPNYYGAFVLDPDGNNVEAVCHQAA